MTQANASVALGSASADLDDLPDLDDLLASAKSTADKAKAAKAARERLLRGGLDKTQLEEDAARIREWEARNLYRAVANVATFTETHCTRCGEYHYQFTGLMRREVHRHVPTTQRWVAVEQQQVELNNEVRLTRLEVPFCSECLEQVGFSFNNGYTDTGTPIHAVEESPADPDESPIDPDNDFNDESQYDQTPL